MILPLVRPLIAVDVETHGKVPPEEARICEIGFHIFYPDDTPPRSWASYVKPELLIAPDTTEVHGITNEMVATAPRFKQLAPSFAKGFKDCDYCGYNVNYDIRVIRAEMHRAGVPWTKGDAYLLDSFRLWRVAEPRTLSDAVRRFLGREPTHAHRASEDAKDAMDVAMAQLEMFQQLPRDLQRLHDLCFSAEKDFVDPDGKLVWDADGRACLNFGKHGRAKTPLQSVPRKYLVWMYNGDFSPEVKAVITEALKGQFPTRHAPLPEPPIKTGLFD